MRGSLDGRALGTWGDVGTFSFDFAKTMTTGEGGMILFKDEATFKRAAAWHDHGHENNPLVPRWEDTRSSSGFNFRMMELQGAVGLAQLKKLSTVISAQRENRRLIWQGIADFPGVNARLVPDGSYETADALVFQLTDPASAQRCRAELLAIGLSTKILPEAYSWHFAGTWEHMPELMRGHGDNLRDAFKFSERILRRAVSLPIGVRMDQSTPERVRKAVSRAIGA